MGALKPVALLLAAVATGCDDGPSVTFLPAPSAPGASDAADPALVADSTGLSVAWVAGDSAAYHTWSARLLPDDTWSAPVRVTRADHDAHPHAEASPRFVAAPGVLGLVWTNQRVVPGRRFPASHIRFARSLDGGATWSAPVTLNDDSAGAPAGHTFHGAAWLGGTRFAVAWLDSRDRADAAAHGAHDGARGAHATTDGATGGGSSMVTVVRSDDAGTTWGPNRALWPSACPCCRVSLAAGPDGGALAAWRQHFAGSIRDVVVAPLPPDSTAEPAAPTRVRRDDWVYPGCPHSGPALARDSAGRAHVAWFTGRDGAAGVFYATGGVTGFGEPVGLETGRTLPVAHPAVVAWPDGRALVAWDVVAAGPRLVLALIDARSRVAWRREVEGSEGADHPVLAPIGEGEAIVAWRQLMAGRNQVRVARVRF